MNSTTLDPPFGWHELEEIDSMSSAELDELPVGAIQLDEAGVILQYNARETQISGRRREDVLGKNFFDQVAPCTNVQEFAGRFREGFRRKQLDVTFPYLFDFEMRPTEVWVTLFYSQSTDTAWVFVRRKEAAETKPPARP